MDPRRAFSFAVIFVILIASAADTTWGSAVGYSFSGTVSFVSPAGPPYGVTIEANTPFSGRFFYDPNTSPISAGNGTNTSIYPQLILSGFSATIGGLNLNADSYAVQVFYNHSGQDEVQILFSSNLTAAPPVDPLMVNGTAYSVGDFDVDFFAPTSLYTNSALPSSLSLSSFTSSQVYLGHAGFPGPIDLIGSVKALAQIPLLPGDLNRDGHVDASDINAMMQALAGENAYETSHDLSNDDLITLGDLDHSGILDNGDLQALLTKLTNGGGSFADVPEPSSISLLSTAICLLTTLVMYRKRNKCRC
ncbi:MAG TPA: PEP-CTERM sorting domain-containing protein [Pirellulales bacterium]|nr:PEP-CTERM sorting domain-containing protein [Pirellulales bacterium]